MTISRPDSDTKGWLEQPWVRSRYTIILLVLLNGLLLWSLLLFWLAPQKQQDYSWQGTSKAPSTGHWAWFNQKQSAVPQKQVTKTKIKAKLLGLIHTEDKKVAVISIAKKAKIYTQGSLIQPGVMVKLIQKRGVILDENGQERLLQMEKIGLSKPILLNKKATKGNQKLPDVASLIEQLPGFAVRPKAGDILPVRTKDGNTGLKLNKLDANVAKILGLQAEDIIVNVNQVPIFNIAKNPSTLTKILASTTISIEVIRKGSPETIRVADTKQLMTLISPLLKR